MFPPYTFKDLAPHLALSEIEPLSRRAGVLLARHQTGRAATAGQMNVLGAIDMLNGLEYHHAAFMKVIEQLAEMPLPSDGTWLLRSHLMHECLAYLNRMGQFYYFATSRFVRGYVPDPEAIIPTQLLYLRFRHKHSAHRSLDAPRAEDTPHHQLVHAWALSSHGPCGFTPKRPSPEAAAALATFDSKSMWRDHFFHFQMYDEADCLNFGLEKEHPAIAGEAYKLLEALLTAP
jgi:hypothetical protein